MAEMNGGVLLPNELLVKIAKDLNRDENFISLALSGVIGNFPSFYAAQITYFTWTNSRNVYKF